MHATEHKPTHAIEPGAEVLDLADELRLAEPEARSWLDVEPHIVTPDLARLTGHASDYEWANWLADVLRSVGLHVVEYPGWKTRGRPRTAGPFTPRGLIWHHDGSAVGPSPTLAKFLAVIGRPAEGIPAPLSQLWVCEGCAGAHPVGTWHVLAAGRANHAGTGVGFGAIGEDMGNSLTLGIETDNISGERTPLAMLDSLVTGSAALLRYLGARDPDRWLAGHKEYAAGRKIDPDDIDMGKARDAVRRQLTPAEQLHGFPGVEHFTLGHQCAGGHVQQLENWLLELPMNAKKTHPPADTFTKWTRQRVRAFQESRSALREDADGYPGKNTWWALQRAARAARSA